MYSGVIGVCILGFMCANVSGPNPYLAALRKRPWESDHGYAKVRRDAFLFWWLHYADGTRVGSSGKPLVVWIQGGPGLAASGVANFAELGPLTMDMRERNHTWMKGRNVLLIDHPVGTGFSYAVNDNSKLYCRYDYRVALDLVRAIREFLRAHPEFTKTPAYIVSQSYGGKIAPRLTYMLHKAVKSGYIKMNLKAVGIGSAWVDPKIISKTIPQYWYHMGLIDVETYEKSKMTVSKMSALIKKNRLKEASIVDEQLYRDAMMYIYNQSVLNVIKPDVYESLEWLEVFVNEYVRPTLSVNQTRKWRYTSDEVFHKLKGNMMLSSKKFVERLLNETKVKVVVYNGNLDATCTMAGAVDWVHSLRWSGADEFRSKPREQVAGQLGYYKAVGRLSLWWVFNAGHWVPEDNPQAMEKILHYMMNTKEDAS